MTKYEPLYKFLVAKRSTTQTLTFEDIEIILRDSLPRSAREAKHWWTNKPYLTQAKAWLDAGWRVEKVDLGHRTVKLTRRG